jgi:hypothetical protein
MKTTENLIRDSLSSGRDLNPDPPEYGAKSSPATLSGGHLDIGNELLKTTEVGCFLKTDESPCVREVCVGRSRVCAVANQPNSLHLPPQSASRNFFTSCHQTCA